MYEMLTGKMPYDGDTAEQVALQHITGCAVPPQELNPDIPEELAAHNAEGDERRYKRPLPERLCAP